MTNHEFIESTIASNTHRLLTVKQAAEVLSVSHTTVYKMLKSGELESVKIGAARRIKSDSVEAVINGGAEA